MEYVAPVKDMRFTLEHVAGLADLAELPGLETAEAETVSAVLEEAAKFAAGVLSPLNRGGDKEEAGVAHISITMEWSKRTLTRKSFPM